MEDNWGQVKTTQNGKNEDMEPEENGSKGESQWEQSGMSEQIHMGWEQYPTSSIRQLMFNQRLRVEQLSHHHYLRHQSNSILFLLI